MLKALTALIILGVSMTTIADAATQIKIPIKQLPRTLDPQELEDVYSMTVSLQVHRGLMRFLPNLDVATDLAESYEVMESGKRIVFHLGANSFANGRRIGSGDVVKTFRRMFKNRKGMSSDLNYIKGNDLPDNVKEFGVRAIDAKTVEFILTKPVALFLTHISTVDCAVLPLADDLSYQEKAWVGAGPYKFVSQDSESVVLELRGELRNRMKLAPMRVVYLKMNDHEAQEAALRGRVDSLDGYSVKSAVHAQLIKSGWKESVTTLTRELFLVLNPDTTPAALRKTVFLAIMNSDLSIPGFSFEKSYGLIPGVLSGHLAKEDWSHETPIPMKQKTKLKMCFFNGEPYLNELEARLKDILSKMNIEISFSYLPISDMIGEFKDKTCQGIARSKFLDYPEGLSILTYFRSNYPANTFYVADKKVDALLDLAIGELRSDLRHEMYKRIQKQILKNYIVVPLVFGSDNRGLWSPKVSDAPPHPLGPSGLPLEFLKLAQ